MMDAPAAEVHEVEDPSAPSMKIWWPVIAVSLAITLTAVVQIALRMRVICPLDPWESIIVTEAYRASAGLPVYTTGVADHSTHIYGPFITYLVGGIFKSTGVSFLPARIISVVCATWIVTALSWIFFRKLPAVFIVAGIAMLTAVHLRTGGYFMNARPDMEALGFALLALILLYQGYEKQRIALFIAGVIVLCIAYLFKQTAAMFALVPLVVMVLRGEGWTVSELVMVVLPPAAIVAVIATMRLLAPEVDYYMIEAVAKWPIVRSRLAGNAAKFIGFMPVLPVAIGTFIGARATLPKEDSKFRWLIAAVLIATPASLVAVAKVGGVNNSYIPALLPLMVLSIVLLARGWESLVATGAMTRWRLHGFAWLVASVLLATAMGGPADELRSLFTSAHGDKNYPAVIKYVSGLQGRVVCPDDPTIPIRALHQPCRSFWAEHDAQIEVGLPSYVVNEVHSASYVVVVDSNWPKFVTPDVMTKWDFDSVGFDGADMGIYQLWRKRFP
jgi:hypothetical protein